LEEAEELENEVRFNGDDILFMVNNRHIAPNTDESFEGIRQELSFVLQQMYGSNDFTLELASEDTRERFMIRISASSNKSVSDLLANLED
jgi:hypothetical protein